MSQFGNQYIPSLSAVTGFATAAILEDLAHNRENQIKNVKLMQHAQLSATQNLAASTEATIMKQADAEEDSAKASILQGGIGLGSPIVSTLYEGYRNDVLGVNSGISNLKTSLGFERTDLGQIKFEEQNLEQWKTVLREGKAPVMSAEDGGIPMQVFADHSPNEVNEQELDALRRKNYTQSSPASDADKEMVASLKTLRGGAKDEQDPDIIKRKQLYSDVEKRLDDQEQSVQNKRARYDKDTELTDSKWQAVFSGLSNVFYGVKQQDAASDRREQATASATEQYAKYVNDSQSQDVQTAMKVYDDINQAQQQASSSYFEGLARANQAV